MDGLEIGNCDRRGRRLKHLQLVVVVVEGDVSNLGSGDVSMSFDAKSFHSSAAGLPMHKRAANNNGWLWKRGKIRILLTH